MLYPARSFTFLPLLGCSLLFCKCASAVLVQLVPQWWRRGIERRLYYDVVEVVSNTRLNLKAFRLRRVFETMVEETFCSAAFDLHTPTSTLESTSGQFYVFLKL